MQTLVSSATTPRSKKLQLGFVWFLLLSPLLPYLITEVYNQHLFYRVTAQMQALPTYPGATLLKHQVVKDPSGHCWVWMYRYETTDTLEQVRAFYGVTLPEMGWNQTHLDTNFDNYRSSESSILIQFFENSGGQQRFTLSVTAPFWVLFEVSC